MRARSWPDVFQWLPPFSSTNWENAALSATARKFIHLSVYIFILITIVPSQYIYRFPEETKASEKGVQASVSCLKCANMHYCSPICRALDAEIHEQECKPLSKLAPDDDFGRFLLRVYTIDVHLAGKWSVRKKVPGTAVEQTSFNELPSLPHLNFHFKATIDETGDRVNEVTIDWNISNARWRLQELMRKIIRNYSRICEYYLQNPIAWAIVPEVAPYGHACMPNAVMFYDGCEVTVRAIRHINRGDPITLQRINIFGDKETRLRRIRRSSLQDECACRLCNRGDSEGKS